MARDLSTQEYFQGLREACGDATMPYRTVARWVKAFRESMDAVQDYLHIGRSHVDNNTDQLLASLLEYGLFTKVKEPLRGVRYNTRDELIHARRRSI